MGLPQACRCSHLNNHEPATIMSITPQDALKRIIDHREIFHDEMLHLMRMIMQGEVSPVMTSAILAGLRVKKESIGEITAAAEVMRQFANPVHVADRRNFIDIVGTGGDGAHSFNISSTVMFVVAAAGGTVAKHGNRSVSSKSGAADVLEALGANIMLNSEQVAASIAQCSIGFMFAPNHHPAMKNVAPVRKELGVRTIFNILGPLTNPASAPNNLLGVFHPDLVGIFVRVMKQLGAERVLAVHGMDGMDEISLCDETLIHEVKDGKILEYRVSPEQFGFARAFHSDIEGGDGEANAKILKQILKGELSGPKFDIVVLNAMFALYCADVVSSPAEAKPLILEAIKSGKTWKFYENYIGARA